MLLTCPNCRTVYDAPADKLRRARKVRCVSCGNVWEVDPGIKRSETGSMEWELGKNAAVAAEEYVPEKKEDVRLQAIENGEKAKDPEWQAFSNSRKADPEWTTEEAKGSALEEEAFSDVPDSSFAPSGDERENERFGESEGFRFYDDEEEPPRFDFNSPSEAAELPSDFKIPEFKQPFAPVDYPDKTFWQEWSKPLFFLTLLCIAGVVWLTFFHSVKSVPMAFKTVTYEFIERDYKKFLIINASLENKSEKFAYPRRFKVVFYSSNGRRLSDRASPSPLGMLPPKETGNFELRLERPPAQAAKAELILDAVDFSESDGLSAPPAKDDATERQKKLRVLPLKDGTENRSPEEGSGDRVLPKREMPVDDLLILPPATEQENTPA